MALMTDTRKLTENMIDALEYFARYEVDEDAAVRRAVRGPLLGTVVALVSRKLIGPAQWTDDGSARHDLTEDGRDALAELCPGYAAWLEGGNLTSWTRR